MNSIYFVSLQLLFVLVVVGLLKLANYKKENRHQQIWVVVLAVLFMIVFLLFDAYFMNIVSGLVDQYFPLFNDYLLVFFNYSILVLFLALKMGGKLVGKIKAFFTRLVGGGQQKSIFSKLFYPIIRLLPVKIQKKLAKKDQKSVAIVYQKAANGIVLKPEWSFATSLCLSVSLIPIVLFAFYILNSVYHWINPIAWALPEYPMLSFILLVEIAWFFAGKKPEIKEGSITGTDAHVQKIGQYKRLFKEYEDQFEGRILKSEAVIRDESGLSIERSDYHYQSIARSDDPTLQLVKDLCDQLNARGVVIKQKHVTMLTHLIEEEDLLIEDPNYHNISPVLFSGIHQLLIRGKKMIVIANDDRELTAIKAWFRQGFRAKSEGFQYIWQIESLQEAMERNINADILVITTGELLLPSFFQYFKSNVDASEYEMVMLPEASKMLSKYDTVIHAFIWKLQDHLNKMPQQIIISKWYEALEEEVQDVLRTKPKDISLKLPKTANIFYMIWQEEGDRWLQSIVMPKLAHRKLDAEAVIALPAIKHGVDDIQLSYQDKSGTYESLKDLIDNRKNLLEYGLAPISIDAFRTKFHALESILLTKRHDNSFVIAKDIDFNFIKTLSDWWASGKKNTFVHVVSPPYLLRDYFADNSDYFLENSEKIAPIVPELSQTTWSTTYLLIERLCNSVISQEELLTYLQDVTDETVQKEPIIEQLNLFLQKMLETEQDFKPFVEMIEEEKFSTKKLVFETQIYYKLSQSVYYELIPNWFQFYELKTRTGDSIGEILAGNIYQTYLPGQLHAINGRLYRVDAINNFKKTIELVYESQTEQYRYHQNRTFHLQRPLHDQDIYESSTTTIDQNIIALDLYQCSLEAITSGYFHFEKGINLQDDKLKYTPLTFHEQEAYERVYQNGNVLVMKWEKTNGAFSNPNQLALTLSYLLNELFVSLFPHGHQYIAATSPLPDDYFDLQQPFSANLKKYIPKFNHEEQNTSDSIYLYIFEDTPLQMGMIERIKDKWLHIFEIVDDYLDWLLHESEQEPKQQFVSMGEEEFPSEFDFSLTLAEVQTLLSNNRLNSHRQQAKAHQQHESAADTKQCDFCKDHFPATEFIQLDDERERCQVCHQTAVDKIEELSPLYEKVRQFFVDDLRVELRQDIHLKMISAKELQELSGAEFVPTEEYDARIVGKAVQEEDMAYIYVENGAPYLQTLATLAHEMTHIWQFDHLNFDLLTLKDLEGHASWIEVYYMEHIGAYKEAEVVRNELLTRNDVYGEGYRTVLEELKTYPDGATPFDFYRK